ncbi:MAG: helix-turn-helix domain-containing protein [Chloroflexi bacterium]|nr:helix-turn-helix domain-containing protein [Chloroflexota bacterium]
MASEISFGEWLKRRRKGLGITQQMLADQVGCSVATIVKIEREERRASRQIADLIAQALQIPEEQREQFIKTARSSRIIEDLDPLPASARDLPADQAPAAQAPVSSSNIPIPGTRLIGRETEVAEVLQLISDPGCRLLTITGEGGIGKTRLALEAARQVVEVKDSAGAIFPDGACFVPLLPVREPEFILPAIADALGIAFFKPSDRLSQLIDHLRSKKMLLIADNAEHLLPDEVNECRCQKGAEPCCLLMILTEIIARTTGVTILVTSREAMRLESEWLFRLEGLPYPDLHSWPAISPVSLDAVEKYSAVSLFIQSAKRRDVHFRLEEQDIACVLQICRQLGGLPLGIELAASWAHTFSCQEIAEAIEQGEGLLVSRSRDIPERHRSIRAVFDQSWELLTGSEKRALQKLSVFRGGFQREAVEQVAGAPVMLVAGLIEKSLLRRVSGNRYDMHELVARYAMSRLAEDPELEAEVRAKHNNYYLNFLIKNFGSMDAAIDKNLLRLFTLDIENIRLAWDWAAEHDRIDLLSAASVAMLRYHEMRGLFMEARALFQGAVNALDQSKKDWSDTVEVSRLLAQAGFIEFRLGNMEESLRLLNRSRGMLEKHTHKELYGELLWYSAYACWFTGAFQDAVQFARESIALNEELGQRWERAASIICLANALYDMGDHQSAVQWVEEGFRASRSVRVSRLKASALSTYARIHPDKSVLLEMEPEILQDEQKAVEDQDHYGIGLARSVLAETAWVKGDSPRARSLYEDSIKIFKEIGEKWFHSYLLCRYGYFLLAQQEKEEARGYFREALDVAGRANIRVNVQIAVQGLDRIASGR